TSVLVWFYQFDQRAAREAIEQANVAKTRFLANISHEIRTPLMAIRSCAELLRTSKEAGDEREKYIDVLDRNSRHLKELVDDILDVAKVEAGELNVKRAPCDLDEQIEYVRSTFFGRALDKGVILTLTK